MLGLLLLFSRSGEGRFFGLCFSLIIPFVWFTAQSGSRKRGKLTPAQRDALQSQAAAMWNFYEDYVNRENHFLPAISLITAFEMSSTSFAMVNSAVSCPV